LVTVSQKLFPVRSSQASPVAQIEAMLLELLDIDCVAEDCSCP